MNIIETIANELNVKQSQVEKTIELIKTKKKQKEKKRPQQKRKDLLQKEIQILEQEIIGQLTKKLCNLISKNLI